MEVTKVETTTTIEISYAVIDAPVMLRRYTKAHRYQPDRLEVTFRDGKATEVQLAGPRVLKNGQHSPTERLDEAFYAFSGNFREDELPDWVTPYLVLDK